MCNLVASIITRCVAKLPYECCFWVARTPAANECNVDANVVVVFVADVVLVPPGGFRPSKSM